MKRLILHIGHGKTGSSALQSAFAKSVESLARAGITYPEHRRVKEAAAGKITSGNVSHDSLIATAKSSLKLPGDTILLSNEGLFHVLLANEGLLPDLAALNAKVEMVLYIRNPLKHAMSVYGQNIKRGGMTLSVEKFLPRYAIPSKVAAFMQAAKSAGVDLTVLNYSNHRADLLGSFANATGIDPALLDMPQSTPINRSMTRAEVRLQAAFNGAWGQKSSAFLSDVLCQTLPEIRSEDPYIDQATYDAFAAAITPVLEQANAHLPPQEAYELEPYPYPDDADAPQGKYTFTGEQIDVVAKSLAARIPTVEETGAFRQLTLKAKAGYKLLPEDVELLTNVALRLLPEAERLQKKKKRLNVKGLLNFARKG